MVFVQCAFKSQNQNVLLRNRYLHRCEKLNAICCFFLLCSIFVCKLRTQDAICRVGRMQDAIKNGRMISKHASFNYIAVKWAYVYTVVQ